MNVTICIVICISKALLLHGAWVLHGGSKAAVNPYSTSINGNAACASLCDSDSNCNGYSIDVSNTACYLSRCDTYLDVSSCTTCYFCSKAILSSSPVCNPENSTLDAGVFETVTPDNTTLASKEATTTADISTSSTSVVSDTTLHPIVSDSTTTAPNNLYTNTFSITTTTELNLIITNSDPVDADNITIEPGVAETTKTYFKIPFHATTAVSTDDIRTTSSLHYYSTDYLKQINGNVTCACVCKYTNISLENSLAIRKNALTLNRTKLSSSIRKLISAHDSRVSSRTIGVMGFVVMGIFVLLTFCLDISSLFFSVIKKK